MLLRPTALALISLFALKAHALGLGEMRNMPQLGQPIHIELDLLGLPKQGVDPSCFSLKTSTAAGDAPNLQRASFILRKGPAPVLEIRSPLVLRDPIIQFSLRFSCEQEVIRDYVVLALPPEDVAAPAAGIPAAEPALRARPVEAVRAPSSDTARESARPSAPAPRVEPAVPKAPRATQNVAPPASAPRPKPVPAAPVQAPGGAPSDRLQISAGGEIGEPRLRSALDLGSDPEQAALADQQRELLRLEFRLLSAMQEQSANPGTPPEKLRELDNLLNELRQRTAALTGAPLAPVAAPVVPVPVAVPVPPPQPEEVDWLDELLDSPEIPLAGLGLLALLGGWGYMRWRGRQQDDEPAHLGSLLDRPLDQEPDLGLHPFDDPRTPESEPFPVDLQRPDEHDAPAPAKALAEMTAPVAPPPGAPAADSLIMLDVLPDTPQAPPVGRDAGMSIALTTMDEHFEANPVMELADIMLSFGRVKGAAQALQEFVDNNPQDALQPWIRLLEIYRMAGMRDEFEVVARNLNRNFNVEVQLWEPSDSPQMPAPLDIHAGNTIDFVLDGDIPPASVDVPTAPRANSLEEMPRLMEQICLQWREEGVLEHLNTLLRDNRGGQRLGFSLGVVDEILFLIEIKETLNKTNKEG